MAGLFGWWRCRALPASAYTKPLRVADSVLRIPITGITGCCAPAASGHAVAAPLSMAINSRRPMVTGMWPSRARAPSERNNITPQPCGLYARGRRDAGVMLGRNVVGWGSHDHGRQRRCWPRRVVLIFASLRPARDMRAEGGSVSHSRLGHRWEASFGRFIASASRSVVQRQACHLNASDHESAPSRSLSLSRSFRAVPTRPLARFPR
jgi:hypothetical protein